MKKTTATLIFAILIPNLVFACATCYGNPEAPMSKGLSFAVLFLVAVVGIVLSVFMAFFLYLRKRYKSFHLN
ncbi:hypothetical protein IT568_08490 [bacterium]|nr:hypothetical protein [bacterium]